MSKNPRFDFMSLVDDKFIAEADPNAPNPAYKSRLKWSHILTISLCLLLVINLAVLLPILLREEAPPVPTPPTAPSVSSGGLNQVQKPGIGGDTEQKPNGSTNLVANEALLESLENLFESASGVIVENGEIVLVDYKTNSNVTPELLREEYEGQLKIYAEALEKMTGLKVKERYLWAFSLGKSVKI